ILFFTYSVITLSVLLIVYLINRTSRDPVAWLWPAPNKATIYTNLMLVNFLLILIAVWAVWWGGWLLISVPVLTSFAAILLYALILKNPKEPHLFAKVIARFTERISVAHKSIYTLNAVLVFILIGVIPAYACFKVASIEEMKLFVRDSQLDLAESMA